MKALGLDCETTGFDTASCHLTEIGAVLFSDGWVVESKLENLILNPAALPLSKEIVDVTGITDDMLLREGIPLADAIRNLSSRSLEADVIIAHNAQFDKSFVEAAFNLYGISDLGMLSKPWLCSIGDMEHAGKKCKKLSHLAVDYGLRVDGSKLHRAVDDVLLMGEMLFAAKATPESMLAYSLEPYVYLKAITTAPWLDKGASNELAKRAGFAWERCPGDNVHFPKSWVRRVKQSKYEEEKLLDVGFKRERILP